MDYSVIFNEHTIDVCAYLNLINHIYLLEYISFICGKHFS